jgi:F420-dependent oxidoreductase-like protein
VDFRIFTEPQQGASYDDLLATARAAEELGFDGWFRSDHFLTTSGDGLPGPTDAWTTLAGLARETSRIRLGTLVSSVTFRHPGLLAIQVAQVDQMSGGRVELGLGTGWMEREHKAYGMPFPPKRFGMLEEQLEIVTGLWSTPLGRRFDFAGSHYRLEDSPALPKPVQQPVPVIVGGGGSAKTPALAARFANEYNSAFVSPAEHAARAARVRQACEAIGRDPANIILSVAGTTAGGSTSQDADRRAANIGSSVERLQANGFAGTASEIIDRIGELGDIGYSRFYFQIMDLHDLDQLDFLSREVVSQF